MFSISYEAVGSPGPYWYCNLPMRKLHQPTHPPTPCTSKVILTRWDFGMPKLVTKMLNLQV